MDRRSALLLCTVVLVGTASVSCRRAGPTKTNVAEVAGAEPAVKNVMRSTLAGTWYNADPNALRAEIATYFQEAQVEPREDIIGLILPHAGYAYSGRTAACAVKSLGRTYTRVVVIGPSHQLPMEDVLSVPRATHYRTPLGEIPLDVEFIRRLLAYPIFQEVPAAHEGEHSVQIEVPLLQYKLGEFKLVPIVAGQCSADAVVQAGRILAGLIDTDTLVVASSDFTHYGPNYQYVPFTNDIPASIEKLDMGAFGLISKKDPRGLLRYRQETGMTMCGCVPVAVLLAMLGADAQAELVRYTTSGALMNDYTNSVSYLAAAFRGAWARSQEPQVQTPAASLTPEDKKTLLTLARGVIQFNLTRQQLADTAIELSEAVQVPRAAFVTVKEHGQLRGCIGDIFPRQPLYKSVLANAANAAFRDPRFTPLQRDELGQITIEISALTPPVPVASYRDIRIGTDGMVMSKEGHTAVFLPQVAPEQGWDLETTLANLSMKAGLPADAWKEGASFQVFQAEVFGEAE